jgi:hypothetical protein
MQPPRSRDSLSEVSFYRIDVKERKKGQDLLSGEGFLSFYTILGMFHRALASPYLGYAE